MTMTEYLAAWDPMGFIEELEAPEYEYGVEAVDIALRFRPEMTQEELVNLVCKVFSDRIGTVSEDFRSECLEREPEIRVILEKDYEKYGKYQK